MQADSANIAPTVARHGLIPWRVVIRTLWPFELSQFRRHLLRLDNPTRIERFGRGVGDEWLAAYAAETDWLRGAVLGCWIDGTLRGVAELRRYGAGWSTTAEAALTVEPAFQHHGLGSILARRLILLARNRGIATLHILFDAGNPRMRRIAENHGARMVRFGDQIEAELSLAPANAATITEEWIGQSLAVMREYALPMGLPGAA